MFHLTSRDPLPDPLEQRYALASMGDGATEPCCFRRRRARGGWHYGMTETKRVGLVLQDLLCGAGGALPSDAKAAALDGILMDGEMQRLRRQAVDPLARRPHPLPAYIRQVHTRSSSASIARLVGANRS
jgi:hypothetical protein